MQRTEVPIVGVQVILVLQSSLLVLKESTRREYAERRSALYVESVLLTFITNARDSALKTRPVFHARNDSRGVRAALRSSPDSERKRSILGKNMRGRDMASILRWHGKQ